jgi:hypothetical protein
MQNAKCRARPKRASVGKPKVDADGADLTSDGLRRRKDLGVALAWALADSRSRVGGHGTAWARLLLGLVRYSPLVLRQCLYNWTMA